MVVFRSHLFVLAVGTRRHSLAEKGFVELEEVVSADSKKRILFEDGRRSISTEAIIRGTCGADLHAKTRATESTEAPTRDQCQPNFIPRASTHTQHHEAHIR